MATFAVGLTAATLFSVLTIHVRLTQTAFELQEEQQAMERMRSRRDRLEMAEAELEAPGRIRREAMGRLGMVLPGIVHFVYVREVQGTADERAEGGTVETAPPVSGP
ncbi:MAG: hypothetical protein IT198_02510 [Acidimicrobiia bacterium]|nr:hypothetical protein [Acidimicrobiia bacterium]